MKKMPRIKVHGDFTFIFFLSSFKSNTVVIDISGQHVGLKSVCLVQIITCLDFKSRSHSTMCDCDLLYQEMECCLRFSDFVHMVRRV